MIARVGEACDVLAETMDDLKVILVGVDFTSAFRGVVETAVRVAGACGATLVVRHIVDAERLERYLKHQKRESEADVVGAAEARLKDELAAIEFGETEVDAGVELGVPGERLLEVGEERGAGLVVLSAHDRVKWGVGAVASHVLRGAKGSVLVLRDWQRGRFRKVGVCVDFSDTSLKAVRQAARVARVDGAPLELVHVIYPVMKDYYGDVFRGGGDGARLNPAEVKKRVKVEIDDYLAPVRGDIETLDLRMVILESTSPSAAITAHFDEVNVDLAVLGTTGKRSFFGLRLGSNAERLVRDTTCSVLAVKG